MFDDREKAYLLTVARGSIINKFLAEQDPEFEHPVFETDSEALTTKRPVFVSLYSHGTLRGSRGHFIPYNPVLTEVYDQANFAAFEDDSLPPLQAGELDTLEIVVSVLTKPYHTNPNDVVLGQHGIMVKKGTAIAALLLPHVAVKQGFTVEQFWGHCCEAAGLASNTWSTGRLSLLKFEAEEFGDQDPYMQFMIQELYRASIEEEQKVQEEEENVH